MSNNINSHSEKVSPEHGKMLLQQLVIKGNELVKNRPLTKEKYSQWKILTENYLERAFGINSSNVKHVMRVGTQVAHSSSETEADYERGRVKYLNEQLSQINGLIEVLESEISIINNTQYSDLSAEYEKKIFIVHGHDNDMKNETARLLENLHQDITILHEKPNEGKTIIEKFETHSKVGFAVVLLSPDDRGGTKNTLYEEQQFRARQNVILELGYFLGKLGRNRVCALHSGDVEIPSDFSGVIYIKYNNDGAWKYGLCKELKTAGFEIDMNEIK